jgi:hypothetical protein
MGGCPVNRLLGESRRNRSDQSYRADLTDPTDFLLRCAKSCVESANGFCHIPSLLAQTPAGVTFGGMAERLKAPVLKTGDGRPSGGSNPSPSASLRSQRSGERRLPGVAIASLRAITKRGLLIALRTTPAPPARRTQSGHLAAPLPQDQQQSLEREVYFDAALAEDVAGEISGGVHAGACFTPSTMSPKTTSLKLLEVTSTRPVAISDRLTLSLIPYPVFSSSVAPSCTVTVPAFSAMASAALLVSR